MVDRSMMHLLPRELLGYFDGSLQDRRVYMHLGACAHCRSRLRDMALVRIMLSSPEGDAPGGHVEPRILARYVEDTLSMGRDREVEKHLAQCRCCLLDFVSLKTARNMPLDKYPPAETLRRLKEKLSSNGSEVTPESADTGPDRNNRR